MSVTGAKLSRDQFEVKDDRVTRKPTNAWFSGYQGQTEISNLNRAQH
jgi:hypothetical protein